jgi:uncharacterized protein (TIGR00369 family)
LQPPDPEARPIHDGPLPGFDGLYGLEFLELSGERAVGRVAIDDRHLQAAGIVHGGVYASAAESLATHATFVAVGPDVSVAGLSNVTNFLRPVGPGQTVHALGTPRHRGRTTWVWEVELRDGADRACAIVRVTVAIRPPAGA